MATVREKPTGPRRRPKWTVAMPPDGDLAVERVAADHTDGSAEVRGLLHLFRISFELPTLWFETPRRTRNRHPETSWKWRPWPRRRRKFRHPLPRLP